MVRCTRDILGKQEMVAIVPPLTGHLFFPVGQTRCENIIAMEIVEYMLEHKMNGVTHQLQQHKFIWDPNARGV